MSETPGEKLTRIENTGSSLGSILNVATEIAKLKVEQAATKADSLEKMAELGLRLDEVAEKLAKR